mmetsp:Transcript_10766/g.24073  ORF Transcript_10766/g.24073 Transcript_10766/m.24073 type:complete len:232 (-) Transcript_10766:133-828(-)
MHIHAPYHRASRCNYWQEEFYLVCDPVPANLRLTPTRAPQRRKEKERRRRANIEVEPGAEEPPCPPDPDPDPASFNTANDTANDTAYDTAYDSAYDTLPPYDGHHIALYVNDFQSLFLRAQNLSLTWDNPRFPQSTSPNISEALRHCEFRVRDVVDVSTGEVLYQLEHEIRSLRHVQFCCDHLQDVEQQVGGRSAIDTASPCPVINGIVLLLEFLPLRFLTYCRIHGASKK